MGRRTRARTVAARAAVLLVLLGLVVVPAWPGVFTVDSQALYRHGLEHRTTVWYTPLLGVLWGLLGRWGLPPSAVFVTGCAALLLGLERLLRTWLRGAAALLATTVIWLWPPVYGLAAWVGRDVWFAAAVLWAVALMAEGGRRRPTARRHLLTAVAVAALAAVVRQNGLPVLAVAVGFAVLELAQGAHAPAALARPPWRRVALAGGAACLAAVVFVAAHMAAVAALGVTRDHPEQTVYVSDLVGMSVAAGRVLLPEDLYPEGELAPLEEHRLRGWQLVMDGRIVGEPNEPGNPVHRRIARVWREAVRAEPAAYAAHRLRLQWAQLGFNPDYSSAYFATSDRLSWDGSAALQQRFPSANAARLAYLQALGDGTADTTLWHLPLGYLLAGLGGAGLLTRAPAWRRTGVMLLVLQLSLQGTLLVLAPVAQYRYQYFQVLLGPAVLLGALAVLRRRRREDEPEVLDGGDRQGRATPVSRGAG